MRTATAQHTPTAAPFADVSGKGYLQWCACERVAYLASVGLARLLPLIIMQRCCQSTASGFYKRHLGETLLIYLDANIVQYCADYEDFIFGDSTIAPVSDDKLLKELEALRELVELEQLGGGWDVAAPAHLMKELLSGKPTPDQRKVYAILLQAWQDSEWKEFVETNEEKILSIERSLRPLNFKDATDRWHLAEAIALGSSWFLTNDKNIIRRTRQKPEFIKGVQPEYIRNVQGVRVARPSECVEDISTGLFLR